MDISDDQIETRRIVDYSLRMDVGAVTRRLGFLLETCGVDQPAALDRLRAQLTDTYHLLDPTLPVEGHRVARWRLRLNVTADEIAAVRST